MSKDAKDIKRRLAALEAAKNKYEWAAEVLREHVTDNKKAIHARPKKSKHGWHKKTQVRAGEQFLQSYEWRKLRLQAIKLHGRKCQCCGASPETGAVLNVDHIKPRKFFPEFALTLSNLQVLCHECNHGKGNWDMTDWRAKETQG